eukprot:scaffold651912_cov38-Prasinocladus_malaysianus.AAC.1
MAHLGYGKGSRKFLWGRPQKNGKGKGKRFVCVAQGHVNCRAAARIKPIYARGSDTPSCWRVEYSTEEHTIDPTASFAAR